MSARKHILLDILGSVISLPFFPISKNPRIGAILEFVGWLAAVVIPIKIVLQLGRYLHDRTPAWVDWPVEIILLVVLFCWTVSWILYAWSRLEPEIPGSEAAIEAWFRTHFPDMPAKYRIGDIQISSFDGMRPASATISIDDGNGYFVVLDYDLRSKQMRGCWAEPNPHA
jgi:hypothetical protein